MLNLPVCRTKHVRPSQTNAAVCHGWPCGSAGPLRTPAPGSCRTDMSVCRRFLPDVFICPLFPSPCWERESARPLSSHSGDPNVIEGRIECRSATVRACWSDTSILECLVPNTDKSLPKCECRVSSSETETNRDHFPCGVDRFPPEETIPSKIDLLE